jgi:predicted AAA+ superfamily ATPase
MDKLNRYLNEFMIYGGYPRVVISESEEEKQLVLKNIYDTYFLKEIKGIFNLASDHQLSKLMNALALQVSGISNYNELSILSGLKYTDLMKHLNILLKTFITLESRPFYTNKRTELVKSPKIFFMDNGFRNSIIKNFQPFIKRNDSGYLRKNFVAAEFVKAELALNFRMTKSKAEVDFVIRKESKKIPVEVKSKLTIPKMTKSFRSFINKYKPECGYIASEDIFAVKKLNETDVKWIYSYQIPLILNF